MPVEEALTIARQLCEGLEAAHERGIVHRDLKPGNIKMRDDGAVKILDFGLAKALSDSEAREDATSDSPTVLSPATEAGLILGTAAYMSPEQARGRVVDKRTDIWAFGCVLYEMLAGRPVFAGETTTDILAAVIRSEPDWSKLPGRRSGPGSSSCCDDACRRSRKIGCATSAMPDTRSIGRCARGADRVSERTSDHRRSCRRARRDIVIARPMCSGH